MDAKLALLYEIFPETTCEELLAVLGSVDGDVQKAITSLLPEAKQTKISGVKRSHHDIRLSNLISCIESPGSFYHFLIVYVDLSSIKIKIK